MANETKERIPSPAKAAVAQQKIRDDKGRFLSKEEEQAYLINQQAAQQQMERDKINRMLGRGGMSEQPSMGMGGIQQQPQSAVPSNFAQILAANKPGGQLGNEEKLAMLLGKRKRLM